MNNEIGVLKKGVIYYIYDGVTPFMETDVDMLKLVKAEGIKFIGRKAICKCGNIKESKNMSTSVCYRCSKRISRKIHEEKYQKRMKDAKEDALTIAHKKQSCGNSVWF